MAGQIAMATFSVGRSRYTFTPKPEKSFNGSTDYLHGRESKLIILKPEICR